jgi:hypothetical protein
MSIPRANEISKVVTVVGAGDASATGTEVRGGMSSAAEANTEQSNEGIAVQMRIEGWLPGVLVVESGTSMNAFRICGTSAGGMPRLISAADLSGSERSMILNHDTNLDDLCAGG